MTKPRKTVVRIPQAKWRRIHDDWLSSVGPTAALAARHGMHPSTIRNRAYKKEWAPRGSLADDPATIARLLYADLTAELRDSLGTLRNGTRDPGAPEPPATAAQRGPLIRAHRRALIALLDARKPLPGNAVVGPDIATFPTLDLAAARKDILARLARMDAAPPP